MQLRTCKICGKRALARELCSAHYTEHRRAGSLKSHAPVQIQNVPFSECYRVTPTGCWEWTRALLKTGYGAFRRDGRQWRAHRYSYTVSKGPIPDGKDVRHSCDNPKCVNPKHLSLGTRRQNMRDAQSRNRLPKGEHHQGAKLTRTDADRIRVLCETMTQKAVAKVFRVNPSTVSLIVNRRPRGGWA
jgi:hypothetical protein